MTVKLIAMWGGQPPGTLYSTDATTEAAMITAGVAIADLTGAVAWMPPGNSQGLGVPADIAGYTAAQIDALAAAGALRKYATYIANDTGARLFACSNSAYVTDSIVGANGTANFQSTQLERANAPTCTAGSAGVLTGTYYYRVTFVTALGETEAGLPNGGVVLSAQQCNLTNIPTSTAPGVIARRIYRSKNGGTNTILYFLAELSDNTTTTYTDNVADGSLGASAPHVNTTGGVWRMTTLGANGQTFNQIVADHTSTSLGYKANALGTGYNITAVGVAALQANTTASNNCAFGNTSLLACTTGSYNSAYGYGSGQALTSGTQNTIVGKQALNTATIASLNTAVGVHALYSLPAGQNANGNTAIGYYAMFGCASLATYNTALGYYAGNADISGNYNTFIGDEAGSSNATSPAQVTSVSSSVAIGRLAATTRSRQVALGSPDATNGIIETQLQGQVRVSYQDAALTAPNAAAILQVDDTTRGFLPPRMTTSQKNAIASPPEGLVVYDTTLHKLCVRTASAWETITSA